MDSPSILHRGVLIATALAILAGVGVMAGIVYSVLRVPATSATIARQSPISTAAIRALVVDPRFRSLALPPEPPAITSAGNRDPFALPPFPPQP